MATSQLSQTVAGEALLSIASLPQHVAGREHRARIPRRVQSRNRSAYNPADSRRRTGTRPGCRPMV